ncbi:Tyrosinase [Drechslerella dactyloides]|uniref:tyrosinase n=1 Tax=Drechslerella dactyloides TaxID=74499 RepID=A0AAD6IYQ0_DREDA|nr:Tyrosinase [Drechslerella dactyloides]
MLFKAEASSALIILAQLFAEVHAAPANYEADPDLIRIEEKRQLQTLNTRPFTRIPATLLTLATNTRIPLTTTRSSTLPVYTLPTTPGYTPPYGYTTPPYGYTTPPYGYTTPPYGYTTPGTTTSTRTTSTTSTKSSATPGYTPVIGANNTCYERLKIQTLQEKDKDQFNMLLLALEKIQQTPDSNPFGWYQIAGIHGRPYVTWQMGPTEVPYDPSRGYCTHGSILFTTWHRPYLLALEQALFHAAMAIAATFSGAAQTQYLAAAARLRLPYWDWADPVTQSYLPPITMNPYVNVYKPDMSGNPVLVGIDNPLFAYKFLSASSIAPLGSPFNAHMITARWPNGAWVDNSAFASSNMQSGFAGRVLGTYNAFLSGSYNLFSNRIEGVHDGVHGATGGGGNLGSVPTAAFDPLFWLHHCNVDRIMAMFQAMNPSLWLTPAPAVGTFARPNPPNTIDDTNSLLYPFRRADGSFWISSHTNPVGTIWTQNYGYPEVPCSYRGRRPEDLDTFTTNQANTLYARGRPPIPGPSREWNVRLLLDQAEIPGAYDIYVYGGTRPSDPYGDPYGKGYIGSLSSMTPGAPDQYKDSRIRYVDVPLNAYLKEYGYYGADPYKITDYISKDLYYTIIANGKPCSFQDLYTAKIAVYSRDIYDSGKQDQLPYYTSEPVYHLNVTRNIPGGIKSIEEITYPVKVDGSREVPWPELNSTRIQT